MLRQSLGKIVALVIAISLLTAGIAPANPSCKAQCCLQAQGAALHDKLSIPAADLLSDCCSDLKTAPCPRALRNSSAENKEYALAAPAVKPNPVRVKLGAKANDILFLSQPYFHLFTSLRPNIRGPSVPLYLQTRTLLI